MTESQIGLAAAGTQAAGALFAGFAANRQRKIAKDQKDLIKDLEASRQEIINPYENVTSLAGQISNPYANLAVATQAADMQAEQADIALANTLDNLRQTGAGGATALAQAALKSKQGVSASLEIQEAQNEKLRAQGESQTQTALLAEQRRLQTADAQGKAFVYGEQEEREMGQLDRAQAQLENAQAQQYSSRGQAFGALAGAGKSLAGVEGLDLSGLFPSKSYRDYKKGGDEYYNIPSGLSQEDFKKFNK
tara:strand:+ start:1250 stop:1999 length:750 start_codon:yes stop_codon:yes gene_type:complete